MASIFELDKKRGTKTTTTPKKSYSIFDEEATTGVTSSSTKKEEDGGFSLGSFALDVVKAPFKTLAAPFAMFESGIRGLEGKKQETALQQFAFNKTKAGSKQEAGAAAERAFDALTFGIGGSAIAAVGKQIVKEGGKATLKQIVKQAFTKGGAKVVAKHTLLDASVGAGYGVAGTFQEDDTTNTQLATSALIGAGIGILLPPLFEIGIRGAGLAGRGISKSIAELVDRTATRLEDTIEKATAKVVLQPWHLPNVQVASKQSLKTTFADVASRALRRVQRIDFDIRRGVFKEAEVERVFGRAEKAGIVKEGTALVQTELTQRANAAAANKAKTRIERYVKEITRFGSDEHFYGKQWSQYMDLVDRMEKGLLPEGTSASELLANFTRFRAEVRQRGAEFEGAVRNVATTTQRLLRQVLNETREVGRISRDDFDRIVVAHPNYLPHRVLDFAKKELQDTEGTRGISREMKMQKAKGSARSIADPDEAIIEVIIRESYLNERKRALNAFEKSLRGNEEFFGVRRLKTKEQIIKIRDLLVALKDKIRPTKEKLRVAKSERRFTKEEQAKLDTLEKQYDETVETIRDDLSAFLSDEDYRVIASVIPDKEIKPRPIPEELLPLAEGVSRYTTFAKFQASKLWNRLVVKVEQGLFERNGYSGGEEKALRKFFNDAKSRGGRLIKGGERLTLREVTQKGLAKGATEEAKLFRKIGQQGIVTESARDALNLVERELANLKEAKAQIRATLEKIRPEKIAGVDIPSGMSRLRYLNDGIEEEWLIPTDLKRALFSVGHPAVEKLMDILQNSTIGRFATAPARLLKQVATQKNPVFLFLANPIRDVQGANFIAQTTGRDLATSFSQIMARKNPAFASAYQKAQALGVFSSGFVSSEIKPMDLTYRALQKHGIFSKSLSDKLLSAPNAIEEAGLLFEQSVRMAVFLNAGARGLSPREAARLAADASVDFGRKGDVTQLLNQVIPYFNATVQGSLGFVRYVGKDPQQYARKAMYLVGIPTIVLRSWNSQYESIDNISDIDKQRNWIIIVSETPGRTSKGKRIMIPHYLKIPKGFPQQFVSYPLEKMLDIGMQDPSLRQDTLNFLAGWATLGTPVDFTDSRGQASVKGIVGGFAPSGTKLPIELVTNYSFFRGKAIEPEWVLKRNKKGQEYWEDVKNLPASEQFSDGSVSEVAELLGGALGLSPSQINYMINTGVFADVLSLVDLGIRLPTGEQTRLEQSRFGREATLFEKIQAVPFLRRFTGSSFYGAIQKEMEEEAKIEQTKAEKKLELFKKR